MFQADMYRWRCSYPPLSKSDARGAARFRFSQVVATIFVWWLASVLNACTVDDQSEVAVSAMPMSAYALDQRSPMALAAAPDCGFTKAGSTPSPATRLSVMT
jgi:hypothetical protein